MTNIPRFESIIVDGISSADGALRLMADPKDALDAATKRYVDGLASRPPVAAVGAEPPVEPVPGQLWFDGNRLLVWHYGWFDVSAPPPPVQADTDAIVERVEGGIKGYLDSNLRDIVATGSGQLVKDLVFGRDAPQQLDGFVVTVSDVAPASPVNGQLWFDSVSVQTYIWYVDGSGAWVPVNTDSWAIGAGGGSLVGEAPTDGQIYGRNGASQSWTPVLPISGGTLTGALTLASDPTAPSQAATKGYVDTKFASAGSVTSVVAGAGLLPGTITTSGTLSAQWQAGVVSALGAGFQTTGAFLSTQWQGGLVTSVGLGLSSASGILSAQWKAGTVTLVGAGLVLSGGTLSASVSGGGGISEAPNDANTYGRHALAWTPVLPTSGGTITGNLTVTGVATVGAVTGPGGTLDVTAGAVEVAGSLAANGIASTNGLMVTAGGAAIQSGGLSVTGTIGATGNVAAGSFSSTGSIFTTGAAQFGSVVTHGTATVADLQVTGPGPSGVVGDLDVTGNVAAGSISSTGSIYASGAGQIGGVVLTSGTITGRNLQITGSGAASGVVGDLDVAGAVAANSFSTTGSALIGNGQSYSSVQASGSGAYNLIKGGPSNVVQIGDTSSSLVSFNLATNGAVTPQTDNTLFLGASWGRWISVWSANGTIQTSDPSVKKDMAPLPDRCLDLVRGIAPMKFRWQSDSEDSDMHWGFNADDVKRVIGPGFAGYVKEGDALAGLRVDQLVAVLWKAVQELAAERK